MTTLTLSRRHSTDTIPEVDMSVPDAYHQKLNELCDYLNLRADQESMK